MLLAGLLFDAGQRSIGMLWLMCSRYLHKGQGSIVADEGADSGGRRRAAAGRDSVLRAPSNRTPANLEGASSPE